MKAVLLLVSTAIGVAALAWCVTTPGGQHVLAAVAGVALAIPIAGLIILLLERWP